MPSPNRARMCAPPKAGKGRQRTTILVDEHRRRPIVLASLETGLKNIAERQASSSTASSPSPALSPIKNPSHLLPSRRGSRIHCSFSRPLADQESIAASPVPSLIKNPSRLPSPFKGLSINIFWHSPGKIAAESP
uniref:Uncharacterized protein n=1 Tax=Nymphaea colorata TaxID=210225 RepID=A0A5K1CV51_9MAGN